MACSGYDLAVSLDEVSPDVDGVEELDATSAHAETLDG